MRAKPVRSDPAFVAQQRASVLKRQPRLALLSYFCGLIGSLLAVHDYHHYNPDRFGLSTIFLGAAILLYALSLKSKAKPRSRR